MLRIFSFIVTAGIRQRAIQNLLSTAWTDAHAQYKFHFSAPPVVYCVEACSFCEDVSNAEKAKSIFVGQIEYGCLMSESTLGKCGWRTWLFEWCFDQKKGEDCPSKPSGKQTSGHWRKQPQKAWREPFSSAIAPTAFYRGPEKWHLAGLILLLSIFFCFD